MADGDITLSQNPNVDTALVEKDGKLLRAVLQETPAGTLQLSDSPNVDTGYIIDDGGNKHKVHLVATPDGTLETEGGVNSGKGYIIDGDGKKHRVSLVASLAGGGSTINNEDITITDNGTYTASEGYTGIGTATVNVPTSAPDFYITWTKSGTDITGKSTTGTNFTGITSVNGQYAFAYAFAANSNITQVFDFSSITRIYSSYAFYYAFYKCSTMTGVVDFSNLTNVSSASGALSYAFSDSGITEVKMGKLTNVESANSFLAYAFTNCPHLTKVDLNKLTVSTSDMPLRSMCQNCPSLTEVDVSSYTVVGSSAFNYAFAGCSSLTTLKNKFTTVSGYNSMAYMLQNCTSFTDADVLQYVATATGSGCFSNLFDGCTALTSLRFKSLTSISGAGLGYMFKNCSHLESVWFYSLTTFGTAQNIFNYMLNGCSNVVVHFRKSAQSTIGSWSSITNGCGGTNTSILFDIIGTIIDTTSKAYNRSQIDSTATATAWKASGVLYYTSGTSEPAVNDTIYSDAACTTAVATIGTIV